MKTTFIALALASVAFAGAPAAAEEMAIGYSDLNLATAQGQKILERRINDAARKVCGVDEATTGTRLKSLDAKRCYAEAKAAAQKRFAAIIAEQQLGG